jgi:hypothetical protein
LVFAAVPLAMACWAFYTSLSGRLLVADLLK